MELNKALLKKQNEGEVLTPAGLLPVLKELAKGTLTEERMTDCPSSPFCSFQDASWLETYFLFFKECIEVSASSLIFQIQGGFSWSSKETFNRGRYKKA